MMYFYRSFFKFLLENQYGVQWFTGDAVWREVLNLPVDQESWKFEQLLAILEDLEEGGILEKDSEAYRITS